MAKIRFIKTKPEDAARVILETAGRGRMGPNAIRKLITEPNYLRQMFNEAVARVRPDANGSTAAPLLALKHAKAVLDLFTQESSK